MKVSYKKLALITLLFIGSSQLLSLQFYNQKKSTMEYFDVVTFDKQLNNKYFKHNYFDSYLLKFPSSDYLLGMKIYTMLETEEVDLVEKYLIKYLEEIPEFEVGTFVLMAKSSIEYYKYNKEERFELLKLSQQKDDKNINKYVHFELYDYFFDIDKELAKKHLNSSLEIDSFYDYALIEKAILLKEERKVIKGNKLLVDLVDKYSNPDACYLIALDYYDNKEYEKARNLIKKAVDIKEKPAYYLLLADLAFENKTNRFKHLKKAVEVDNTDKIALQTLGWYFMEEMKPKKAIKYFELNYNTFPKEQMEDFLFYSNALINCEEYEKALKVVSQFKNKFGIHEENDMLYILAKSLMNEDDSAIKAIEEYKVNHQDHFEWLQGYLKDWNINIVGY